MQITKQTDYNHFLELSYRIVNRTSKVLKDSLGLTNKDARRLIQHIASLESHEPIDIIEVSRGMYHISLTDFFGLEISINFRQNQIEYTNVLWDSYLVMTNYTNVQYHSSVILRECTCEREALDVLMTCTPYHTARVHVYHSAEWFLCFYPVDFFKHGAFSLDDYPALINGSGVIPFAEYGDYCDTMIIQTNQIEASTASAI